MTWIQTIPFEEADEKLRRVLEARREFSAVILSASVIPAYV
jgi:hypothetical protein